MIKTNGTTVEERLAYGYHDRLIALELTDPTRTITCTIQTAEDSGKGRRLRPLTMPNAKRGPTGMVLQGCASKSVSW